MSDDMNEVTGPLPDPTIDVPALPARAPDAHKGDMGRVLVLAGYRDARPADPRAVQLGRHAGAQRFQESPLHFFSGRLVAAADEHMLGLSGAVQHGPGYVRPRFNAGFSPAKVGSKTANAELLATAFAQPVVM